MKHILVVDDDYNTRSGLAAILDCEGYRVSTAANGLEAIELLQEEPQPSLILLDLMMPVMDGVEFRKHQQEDPRWAKIPVVCLSAKHDAAAIARDMKLDECVRKPFDIDEIGTVVRRHCPDFPNPSSSG